MLYQTGTFSVDAVLAQPGRCIECGEHLKSKSLIALCPGCCGHDEKAVFMDDARDGVNGRIHWDCIACGSEVVPSYEDGLIYETVQ